MTVEERNAADQDFITREALRIKREKNQKNDKDQKKKEATR